LSLPGFQTGHYGKDDRPKKMMETFVVLKVSIVLPALFWQNRTMETSVIIFEKAFELFKRYGIRSVTMDDVATQCGISKKTLYQHFEDKDTLVNSIMAQMINRSEHQCVVDLRRSENALHEIFLSLQMLKEMFDGINPVMLFDLHKYYPAANKKLEDHKQRFLYSIIKDNLVRGIEEGLYRPEINVEIITLLHLSHIANTFEQESFRMHKFSLLEIQMEVMLHYVYGISTSKGVKLIEKYRKQMLAFSDNATS
jgi:AcrR family transcriptional regulator